MKTIETKAAIRVDRDGLKVRLSVCGVTVYLDRFDVTELRRALEDEQELVDREEDGR